MFYCSGTGNNTSLRFFKGHAETSMPFVDKLVLILFAIYLFSIIFIAIPTDDVGIFYNLPFSKCEQMRYSIRKKGKEDRLQF